MKRAWGKSVKGKQLRFFLRVQRREKKMSDANPSRSPSRVNLPRAWRVRGAWKEVRMWLVTGDHERPTFEVGETTAFADLQEVVLRMSNQNVWHRRQSSGTIWNNGKSYSFRKPRKAFSVLICFINKILPSSLAWNSCWNCLEGLRSSSFGQEHFVSWLWYQLFYCYFIRRKQLKDVDEGRRERQLKLSERCVMKA